MTAPNQSKDREDKAVAALISAILHVGEGDVSEDEIRKYLKSGICLSSEDEAALQRLGSNPMELVSKSETSLSGQPTETEFLAALHRKKPAGGFSPKTEEEIRKKREELLAKLRKKKSGH
ncbi:MAG TPA: hypothetical protein P5186_13665 [Candidatus Paceibacterota bacterium]|nr:hypothetical protein [Candidatus Paceibacterota bacterium]